MDERELRVRASTYRLFVDLGRTPSVAEVADDCDLGTHETMSSWRALHDQHAIVLNPRTAELRMANPFSAVSTAYPSTPPAAGGTRTAPGMRSGSAVRSTSTARSWLL